MSAASIPQETSGLSEQNLETPPAARLSASIPRKSPRKVLQAKQKQAISLELKKLREERKKRKHQKFAYRCKLCAIKCTSRRSFVEHSESRRHRYKVSLKDGPFYCSKCKRYFESQVHLERQLRGNDHFRVVSALSRKTNA